MPKFSIPCVTHSPSSNPIAPWGIVTSRCTASLWVAVVVPHNPHLADPRSERWLLWNQLSSSGRVTVLLRIETTLRIVSGFMCSDPTETPFIPQRSWRRAQQWAGIGSRTALVVMDESLIEFCETLIRQKRHLYRSVAGAEPNNGPESDTEPD